MEKNFIKSIFGFSMASWVQAGIGFVAIPIITRAFVPAEYAKINLFILIMNLCVIFVKLSTEQSYIRFYQEKEDLQQRKSLLTQCVTLNLVVFAIFLIFILLLGERVSLWLFEELNSTVIYVYLPLMVLATIALDYQRIYFKMSENVVLYFVISILMVLASKLSIVGASFIEPEYGKGIGFMTISSLLVFIIFTWICRKGMPLGRPQMDRRELEPIIRYSLPFIPVAALVYLNTAITQYFLKEYISYSALGIYLVAVTVANLMLLVQTGFSVYWGPFMFRNYKTHQDFIKKVHSYITVAMVAFSLIVILFGNIIFLLIGADYHSGQSIFAFLLIPNVTLTIGETTCYGIYINKKTYLQIISSGVALVISVLACLLMIPTMGVLGAAIANMAGGITTLAIRTFLGQREYRSVERFSRTVLSMSILVMGAFINYFVNDSLQRSFLLLLLLTLLSLIYKHELLLAWEMGIVTLHKGDLKK